MPNRVFASVTVLALLVGAAAALPMPSETPADEGFQGRPVPHVRPAGHSGTGGTPLWERLRGLTRAERNNAVIDLDSESELANRIEELWNSGKHDAALALLPELAPEDLGIGWREPIAVPETDWGTDVLVSTRDSVEEMELDVDNASGNLFCFLRYEGDGRYNSWSCNLSTDGGATWSETYDWWASYEIPCISAVVVDTHAYIGFPEGGRRDVAYLVRMKLANGARDTFPGGNNRFYMGEVTSPDSITELVLASNQQFSGDRLYCSYLTNNGALTTVGFATDDFDTFDFPGVGSGVTEGIDLEWNGFPCTHPLVFSFLNGDDRVRVYGYNMTAMLDTLYAGAQTAVTGHTSLGCKMDTVMVVFDQMRSSDIQTRYLIKYGDTTLWYQGGIGDTTLGFSQSSDVTGRWNGGFAVAYWQQPQDPWGLTFRRRPYRGQWSDPEAIQDGNTYSGYLPSVQRVAPGGFGVVFKRSGYGGRAYFDRNDWTGVAEERKSRTPASRSALPTMLNGVLRLPGSSPAVLLDATGRRVADLAPGGTDISQVAPGIYFVRRAADRTGVKVVISR